MDLAIATGAPAAEELGAGGMRGGLRASAST